MQDRLGGGGCTGFCIDNLMLSGPIRPTPSLSVEHVSPVIRSKYYIITNIRPGPADSVVRNDHSKLRTLNILERAEIKQS